MAVTPLNLLISPAVAVTSVLLSLRPLSTPLCSAISTSPLLVSPLNVPTLVTCDKSLLTLIVSPFTLTPLPAVIEEAPVNCPNVLDTDVKSIALFCVRMKPILSCVAPLSANTNEPDANLAGVSASDVLLRTALTPTSPTVDT